MKVKSLINESITLDFKFLKYVKINIFYKLFLLILKYFLLVKNVFSFKYGKSKMQVMGETFYYPNIFGFVSIERVLGDNYHLKDYVPQNGTVIDVGAHVGEFNFFSRKYLKAKEVISFEPFKKSFELLKKNTGNKNIFNYAISSKPSATLFVSKLSTQLNSLKKESVDDVVMEEKVECIKLDEFLQEKFPNRIYDLLKIDVEGAEFDVLQTAKKTIEVSKYVVVELSVTREAEGDFSTIISYLKETHPDLKIVTFNSYHTGERSIDVLLVNEKLAKK